MPYIEVKTTAAVDGAAAEEIKSCLGKAISVIPGKSEGWLMVSIEGGASIWFRGDADGDSAMVRVAVYGTLRDSDADRMTAEVTKILSEKLGISPDRVYVAYSEHSMWGWNGNNF